MADVEPVFDPTLKKKKKSKSKPAFVADDDDNTGSIDTLLPSATADATDADGVTDMMAALSTKKKKKSKSSKDNDDNDSVDASAVDGPGGDGSAAFDAKKKKKKKKAAAADFDALLEQAGVSEQQEKPESADVEKAPVAAKAAVNDRGETDFTYEQLLDRFFKILAANNPDLASDRSGHKYKIPPPEVKRDGKKTLFVNIKDISDRLHRPVEHVISFLYAELATTGSVDGSNRLVIKGRFQQKQIETVLRKYIVEYVTCKTCKSIDTGLRKENRLFFLICNSCGSSRSVSSIKTGFQAVIKRQKPTS